MINKKQYERGYFDLLQQRVADFPVGAVTHDDSPDFRVESTERVVGIEVTRMLEPEARHEQSERELIVERAREVYQQRQSPHLVAAIHFGEYPRLTKQDRQPLAESIAQLVAEANIPESGFAQLRNDFSCPDRFPEKINSILLVRPANCPECDWHTGATGWINESFCVELQSEIDKKNEKLDRYLKHCSECWLIVGADWACSSSFLSFSSEMLSFQFAAGFTRVYFCEGGTGDVHRLSLT